MAKHKETTISSFTIAITIGKNPDDVFTKVKSIKSDVKKGYVKDTGIHITYDDDSDDNVFRLNLNALNEFIDRHCNAEQKAKLLVSYATLQKIDAAQAKAQEIIKNRKYGDFTPMISVFELSELTGIDFEELDFQVSEFYEHLKMCGTISECMELEMDDLEREYPHIDNLINPRTLRYQTLFSQFEDATNYVVKKMDELYTCGDKVEVYYLNKLASQYIMSLYSLQNQEDLEREWEARELLKHDGGPIGLGYSCEIVSEDKRYRAYEFRNLGI